MLFIVSLLAVLFILIFLSARKTTVVGARIIDQLEMHDDFISGRQLRRELRDDGLRLSGPYFYHVCALLGDARCLSTVQERIGYRQVWKFKLRVGARLRWSFYRRFL